MNNRTELSDEQWKVLNQLFLLKDEFMWETCRRFLHLLDYIPSSFGRRLVKTSRLKIAENILVLAAGYLFPEDF